MTGNVYFVPSQQGVYYYPIFSSVESFHFVYHHIAPPLSNGEASMASEMPQSEDHSSVVISSHRHLKKRSSRESSFMKICTFTLWQELTESEAEVADKVRLFIQNVNNTHFKKMFIEEPGLLTAFISWTIFTKEPYYSDLSLFLNKVFSFIAQECSEDKTRVLHYTQVFRSHGQLNFVADIILIGLIKQHSEVIDVKGTCSPLYFERFKAKQEYFSIQLNRALIEEVQPSLINKKITVRSLRKIERSLCNLYGTPIFFTVEHSSAPIMERWASNIHDSTLSRYFQRHVISKTMGTFLLNRFHVNPIAGGKRKDPLSDTAHKLQKSM